MPRSFDSGRRNKLPPPPSVEDESEALAKEHGESVVSSSSEEEPKNRGDIDQHPILVPIDEDNQERRFVLVSDPNGADGQEEGPHSPAEKYEANTCRKYVVVPSNEDKSRQEKKRPLSKRKSHQDLPPLNTDFKEQDPPIKRSLSRRNREKVLVEQEPRDRQDRYDSPKPADNDFLSPAVRHTAGGRDRAYYDFNGGANRPSRRASSRDDGRIITPDDRHSYYGTSTRSSGPPPHRRLSTNTDPRKREARSTDIPGRSARPLPDDYYKDPDDALAFMMQGSNDIPLRRPRRNSSPPPRPRKSNSPPYPNADRRKLPSRSPSFRGPRQSAVLENDEFSDEDPRYQKYNRSDHPRSRRGTMDPDPVSLLSPDRPSSNRPRFNNMSPLPSPRATQGSQFPDNQPPPSPRSPRSATFPVEKNNGRNGGRSVTPSPPDRGSPPRRTDEDRRGARPRIYSRTESNNSMSNASVLGAAVPLMIPKDGTNLERRPSPTPPASLPRQESSVVDPGSARPYWQPGPFSPTEQQTPFSAQPVVSVRRFSEDVEQGKLPNLPDCPRKIPTIPLNQPGVIEYLTVPRTDNFVICADCHQGVFANTEFAHLFVPAQLSNRPPDQPISCDFGSSFWYRIAYLMTLKHGYTDLRLLQKVASVAARNQPCGGGQEVLRIWYSIMDPRRDRPILDFTVCQWCSRMVEALLPNLAGIFVPLDSPSEPLKGVCELHYAPERKRFFNYFDLMETTSDRAVRRRVAPNIQELADRVRDIALVPECRRHQHVRDGRWHVMKDFPEFTVCQECFDEVVDPLLEERDSRIITREFSKTKSLRLAACNLYSERMREIFRKAYLREDIDYLEDKVIERRDELEELSKRFSELMQQPDRNDPRWPREYESLHKRWKEIE